MTLRDTEVIELLADKPELLAIADAVSATQPKPAPLGRRRRRIAIRGGIVAAAAAAAIIALLAAPQGSPSGVLGRALAAIGDGRILHVVTEGPPEGVYVDLKTGHRTPLILRQELWVDRQLHHFHLVLSLDGRLAGDVLFPADAKSGASAPTSNPAFVALWTGYRAALRNGSAKLAGRGTVLGRRVYWLSFPQTSQDHVRFEVAVDAHTYQPILNRTYANGRHFDQRILVAKTVPYRPAEFRRRGPSLLSGHASGGSSSGAIAAGPSAPQPTTIVRAPFLTAGETVAGLELGSAAPLKVTSNFRGKRRSITGLELTYGAPQSRLLSTTVDELPRPDDPNGWKFIPAGSMRIETGEESGTGGTQTLWTGTLKKDGIYITINTPKSEHALLEIARALHPGRK